MHCKPGSEEEVSRAFWCSTVITCQCESSGEGGRVGVEILLGERLALSATQWPLP